MERAEEGDDDDAGGRKAVNCGFEIVVSVWPKRLVGFMTDVASSDRP